MVGALPFNRHLDMCLQNGSVLCICSKASNLFAVSGFGVVVDSWEILDFHLLTMLLAFLPIRNRASGL